MFPTFHCLITDLCRCLHCYILVFKPVKIFREYPFCPILVCAALFNSCKVKTTFWKFICCCTGELHQMLWLHGLVPPVLDNDRLSGEAQCLGSFRESKVKYSPSLYLWQSTALSYPRILVGWVMKIGRVSHNRALTCLKCELAFTTWCFVISKWFDGLHFLVAITIDNNWFLF